MHVDIQYKPDIKQPLVQKEKKVFLCDISLYTINILDNLDDLILFILGKNELPDHSHIGFLLYAVSAVHFETSQGWKYRGTFFENLKSRFMFVSQITFGICET